jgi:predicted mannosyl-3-phosphoglycerate phosphatase (HAD superfamily)
MDINLFNDLLDSYRNQKDDIAAIAIKEKIILAYAKAMYEVEYLSKRLEVMPNPL